MLAWLISGIISILVDNASCQRYKITLLGKFVLIKQTSGFYSNNTLWQIRHRINTDLYGYLVSEPGIRIIRGLKQWVHEKLTNTLPIKQVPVSMNMFLWLR